MDCSALIPCGKKSQEEKEAIQSLASALSEPIDCVTIYLSQHLIKVYHTKVAPLLRRHHPLTPFQVKLLNLLPYLREVSTASRGSLCRTISPKSMGVKLHILEHTRLKPYDVDDLGLTEDEDKEVLKIALTAAKHQKTFLVTADRHFIENIDQIKLSRKYPSEHQNLRIVKPGDPDLNALLISCHITATIHR